MQPHFYSSNPGSDNPYSVGPCCSEFGASQRRADVQVAARHQRLEAGVPAGPRVPGQHDDRDQAPRIQIQGLRCAIFMMTPILFYTISKPPEQIILRRFRNHNPMFREGTSKADEVSGDVYDRIVLDVFLERPLGYFMWEVCQRVEIRFASSTISTYFYSSRCTCRPHPSSSSRGPGSKFNWLKTS